MVQDFAHPPSGVYAFTSLIIPYIGSLCTVSRHPAIAPLRGCTANPVEPVAALADPMAAPKQFTKTSGEELRLAKCTKHSSGAICT